MAKFNNPVVGLYIYGDDLDPDQISSLIRAQPTTARRKGARRLSAAGQEHIAKTGLWHLHGPKDFPGDLDARIVDLLSGLATDEAVWRRLSDRYECRVSIGIFMRDRNEGAEVRPETIKMLGARGLSLVLDVYDPSDE